MDEGVRWTNRIYPDGTWEANVYQFYTRVLPLLMQALPVPFKLDGDMVRSNTTSAHTALREAFANCLVHASYTTRGNIVVDRHSDCIVLSNPGTMLVSMEEYREGGHSVCRNPLIQKMFVFLGIGEKGGSGAAMSGNMTDTILGMICSNPRLTWKELAELCGISVHDMTYHIRKLKRLGRIWRRGRFGALI